MKLCLRVTAFLALLASAPLCGRAELLIRLDLPKEHSPLAIREMKAELERIVGPADLGLLWQPSDGAERAVNGPTVSVSLRGDCQGRTSLSYENGPLGWTKSVNGRILPFVEISCERVQGLLDPAWGAESQAQRELILGRALGRVLAHELAHAVTRTDHHPEEGLRKRALSPRDLLAGSFRMTSADFERPRPRPQLSRSYALQERPDEPALLDEGGR